MTVLVVDDEPDIRDLMRVHLLASGQEVLEAISAEDAYIRLGITDPVGPSEVPYGLVDLVLMDMTLPGDNGVQAVQRIRADGRYRDIPIIMVTARSDDETLQRAFDAGVTDYIRKPFTRVEFMARVRVALALKETLDQRKSRERELVRATSELQDAQRVLQRLSLSDGLTGVANRRCFDETYAKEWERAARDQGSLALIMADIDHFKRYNDTFGHPAGDDVLRKVAKALEQVGRRPADLLARYGGEEFVMLLPDTDLAGANAVAERAREIVETLNIYHPAGLHALITLRLGAAAATPTPQGAPSSLVWSADRALYTAKQGGRNQVYVYQEPAP